MRIRLKEFYRITNYLFFIVAFFLQCHVDGKYIARGYEPFALKISKYCVIAIGIFWGFLQLYRKKKFIFVKETISVSFAVAFFALNSFALLFFREGDVGFCVELLMRYEMPILYAFVLLNVMEFDDIYNLMVWVLVLSFYGWFLQKGSMLFDLSNYSKISFSKSLSPFESHYFAPSAINCFIFFAYFKKKNWTKWAAFALVLLTFKRPQIVFACLFLCLPLFIDPNTKVKQWIPIVGCVSTVIFTAVYYMLMLPEGEWIIERIFDQSTSEFTSGRSNVLRTLIDSGYKASGLGTSQAILGRGIEMDLISMVLEMSAVSMVVFVFCYFSISGLKLYSVLAMVYFMFFMVTGSGLYNVFLCLGMFLFFGCANYLTTGKPYQKKRLKL